MIDTARPHPKTETPGQPAGLAAHTLHNRDGATNLSSVAPDGIYHVVAIEGGDDHACRLYEMGFAVGVEVALERSGDPAIVRVGRTRLAMSRACLDRVTVVPAVIAVK